MPNSSDMLTWSDAQLDAFFVKAEPQPLDAFVNTGEHRVDLATHEIWNDRHWRGFMPPGLPATDATARLSLGFVKKVWNAPTGHGAETQYFGGGIVTPHTVQSVDVARHVNDVPPGRYVLLGYTDPVFRTLFYDLVKPVREDLMIFRGYTGRFPEGRRGWTALLLRRYPFAQMGIDDHERLFTDGSAPAGETIEGTWRMDALYHANRPLTLGTLRVDTSPDGKSRVTCEPADAGQGPLLPKLVADRFQTADVATLCGELRVVDDQYLVGRWTARLSGASEKLLVASAPGLFHRVRTGGRTRHTLFYLLTRAS